MQCEEIQGVVEAEEALKMNLIDRRLVQVGLH